MLPHSAYPNLDECTSDVDCSERANGYCLLPTFSGADLPTNRCVYGCVRDADCDSSQAICECWGTIGTCVPAQCTSDADCGEGLLCASYDASPDCGDTTYACQSRLDACASDEDCSNFRSCTIPMGKSARACEEQICVIGRPFLVGGSMRSAAPVPRAGWSAEAVAPDDSLTANERDALAEYWSRVGCLEHASIAAFARFTLELLAFGAPAELVELTNRALADETLHAELAFSLASRYGGALLGPGPLEISGAGVHTSLLESVLAAFEEGCIGETIAALEAARARDEAADDAVRGVLARIVEDEARHAELAFRFVQWALPQLGDEAGRELLRRAEQACESTAAFEASDVRHDPALARHGMLSKQASNAVRRSALREVVLPCARALIQNTAGSVYVPNTERSTSQISCRLA